MKPENQSEWALTPAWKFRACYVAGDFWYVVDSGTLEVNKTLPGESEATKVNSYAVGDSFGELALMFNQRRAASVIATSDCVLWAVDQATFQALVKTAANAHQETITY